MFLADAELFPGCDISLVSRADRDVGKHGGLLIACKPTRDIKLLDVSASLFEFSVASIAYSDTLSYLIILIYNPPVGSKYRHSCEQLISCFNYYRSVFENFRSLNSLHNIILLGDFNLPGVCWGSNTSYNSSDNTLLDFLSDMKLQQLIDEPTHRCGNIFDLVFCVDDLDCNVIRSGHQLSDHYPVTFSLSIDTPSRPPVLCFSRSQFDDNLFAFNLSNLYSYIFSPIVHCASFCHDWQLLFIQALDLSLPRKRRKRIDSPYYYSSHTMHVANQKNTADRALQKAWSLPAVLKCRFLAHLFN